MQTLPAEGAPAIEPGRPAYRPFRVRVVRVERLTPAFRQVTVAAPDLREFGDDGLDQRIKLLLPTPGTSWDDYAGPDWYARWRDAPDERRPVLRTYTVRRVRRSAGEVDIVLVDHDSPEGAPGPGVRWVRRLAAGDEVLLVGPDVRSPDRHQGIDFRPGGATRLLLAGDETAAPAIAGILESLHDRPDVTARAFVEVPDVADRLPVDLPARARVHWLARGDAAHGTLLRPAVTAWLDGHAALIDTVRAADTPQVEDIDVDRELLWDSPDPSDTSFYAWMAGEAAAVKALRRAVVTERGVDRRRVAFMGYWRLGQSERN